MVSGDDYLYIGLGLGALYLIGSVTQDVTQVTGNIADLTNVINPNSWVVTTDQSNSGSWWDKFLYTYQHAGSVWL